MIGIFDIVPLLKSWQLTQEPYKSLHPTEKNVLGSNIRTVNSSSEISIHYWYPPVQEEQDSLKSKLKIKRKGSRNSVLSAGESSEDLTAIPERRESTGSIENLTVARRLSSGGSRSSLRKNSLKFSSSLNPFSSFSSNATHFVRTEPSDKYSFLHLSCFVFDSVSLQVQQLLLEGSANIVPIIIAFQYVFFM